jgi:DNA-binding NarL/FixJ family response regulator
MGADELTPRQLETLGFIAQGFGDAQIAPALFVSETTIKRHVRDILSKLGAHNRAHAVHLAHQKGML